MNLLKTLSTLAITALMFSCNTPEPKSIPDHSSAKNSTEQAANEEKKTLDVSAQVEQTDRYRTVIEKNLNQPVVISTAELKPKIKQKWEKLHFYIAENNVVRIKAYPYEAISARTEEFYLKDKKLVLAVIEDNGTGERGKSAENIDKMYYFQDGELIKEVHNKEEAEYTIKASDAEELLGEVKEYLDIYAKQK